MPLDTLPPASAWACPKGTAGSASGWVTTHLERGCLRCLGRAQHRRHAALRLGLAAALALACVLWTLFLPSALSEAPRDDVWQALLAGILGLGYRSVALTCEALDVLVRDRFNTDQEEEGTAHQPRFGHGAGHLPW